MIKTSDLIAPHFYPVHKAIRNQTHSHFLLKGGRGSTKSSFVAIEIILGIINDPEANAVCFRKTGNSIRDSIHGTLKWAINKLGETENFHSIQSPSEITYLPTGQKILLKGLDDPTKIKSIRVESGYFKYLWFEEGEEYDGDDEITSVAESVLRGRKCIEFITFNPPKNPKHWINKFSEIEQNERLVHHSTYLDIPQSWVSKKTRAIVAEMESGNYERYAHQYLGKPVGNADEIVFSGKFESRTFTTPEISELYQSRFFFGADWGFANDPTVLIRCFIKEKCLWIDYEAYKKEVEIDHLGKVLFDKIPESKKWVIESDSSRPETISNLARQGYKIRGAKKWSGSIEDGIEYIKSFNKIIIHSRCPRILQEFENYSYKIDKETKEPLPVIDDKKQRIKSNGDSIGIKDDGIDALRYALSTYIIPKKKFHYAII